MFGNVLVGVDGEQGGRDAIALAERLVDPGGAVALVHVYGAGLMPGRGAELLLAAELEESRALLEREGEATRLPAELIPYADHSVAHALHVLAEQHGAELIVIGSCHRGIVGRVLAGDDAKQTLEHAPCPVAIAPAGYGTEEHSSAVAEVQSCSRTS